MKPVRLGVIGVGLIWQREHQPMLATLADAFTPVAFCDLSEARRAEVSRAFPDAPVYAEPQQLLAQEDVEAVLVLTPIALNAPTALAALRAGKHVIMEKPIARSVAEGQALVATARDAGLRLFVMEHLAYRQADYQLAALLAAGEIGDVMLWNRIQHVDADPAQGDLRYEHTPWRKEADYPLGALFDGGIHLIASLNNVFGPPETVVASGRRLRPEFGEYDHVTMMFGYENGVTGVLSHAISLTAAQNFFHIHGATGVIIVEPGRLIVEKPGQPHKVIDLPAENPRANMWHELVRTYQEGRDPSYSAEEGVRDVALLETMDRAIKSGQRLPIAQS
jgi:scyllo-inositol 2-dehydrogenase (NADP+)